MPATTHQRLGLARSQLALLGEPVHGEVSEKEARRKFYRDLIDELEAELAPKPPPPPDRVVRMPYTDPD